MSITTRATPLLLLTTLLLSPAHAAPPTLADAKADFDAKQYRPCLQKIADILRDGSVEPDARYDLLMLRGESSLQLRYALPAKDAFTAAAKSLPRDADVDRLANAQSIATLIKASKNLTYTSTQTENDTKGFDIVPPETRKVAMAALLNDRLIALRPKITAAMDGTSVVPMQELLPALTDLYMLERASTGDTKLTGDQLKALGAHARDLVGASLKQLHRRFNHLSDLASEPNAYNTGDIGYRGLTTPERTELQNMCDTLVKIEALCQNARHLSQRLGGLPETWEALLADCADLRQTAQEAYDRRY